MRVCPTWSAQKVCPLCLISLLLATALVAVALALFAGPVAARRSQKIVGGDFVLDLQSSVVFHPILFLGWRARTLVLRALDYP